MRNFAIPPDSPLVDEGRAEDDVFAWDHAVIIASMHLGAAAALFVASGPAVVAFLVAHCLVFLLGVPLGFHRLLSHHAFRASDRVLHAFATLGTLTFQGGPLVWAARHRAHHRHVDEPGDSHASARGFWWSHVGWTLYRRPNGFRYHEHRKQIRDLLEHRYLRWLDRHATSVNVAAMLLFALLVRRIDLLLWAFPLRIVVGWHCTWAVNSYAHFAPLRGPKRDRRVRNSWLLALLVLGEGWHENHHRYPGRANCALTASQVDPGYLVLRLLHALGIVRLRREEPLVRADLLLENDRA